MRLFFAVPIPAEVIREITAEHRKIISSALRWVAPENQHFTLRFLGAVEEGRVAEFISIGQETALKHHSFSLTISGAGFFPDEERPRVFWVGAGEGSEKLIALAGDLSSTSKGSPKNKIDCLPEAILERDKEQRSWRTHCGTEAMSDEVAAQKRPGPSGSPVFGSLRRCSSSVCRRGHTAFVAPGTDLKSGTPNSQFYSLATPKDRSFLPHLTVARIKAGEGLRPLPFQKLKSWKTRNFGSFSVNEFCLMESLLLPTGAVYRKVHSFLLGG